MIPIRIALPAFLAAASVVGTLAYAALPDRDPTDLVAIAPGRVTFQPSGDFVRDGRPTAAPSLDVGSDRPLLVMRRQVSEAEYAACVADGACAEPDRLDGPPRADVPAVGLSWRDATAYAAWLSVRTGHRYRLPSDAEWARFAAEAFVGEPRRAEIDTDDPIARRLALYRAEAEGATPIDRAPKPFGAFGRNAHGLDDVSGNVWEWTDGCWTRTALDAGGAAQETRNCGVRIVEGRHRGYVSDFIRDPRGGGCSVGVPPANLGLRLVRDDDDRRRWR